MSGYEGWLLFEAGQVECPDCDGVIGGTRDLARLLAAIDAHECVPP